jgi:hypothetical protein
LVLGAVGFAIGATVARALAKSTFENEWVGELSDNLKEDFMLGPVPYPKA